MITDSALRDVHFCSAAHGWVLYQCPSEEIECEAAAVQCWALADLFWPLTFTNVSMLSLVHSWSPVRSSSDSTSPLVSRFCSLSYIKLPRNNTCCWFARVWCLFELCLLGYRAGSWLSCPREWIWFVHRKGVLVNLISLFYICDCPRCTAVTNVCFIHPWRCSFQPPHCKVIIFSSSPLQSWINPPLHHPLFPRPSTYVAHKNWGKGGMGAKMNETGSGEWKGAEDGVVAVGAQRARLGKMPFDWI